MLHKLFYLSLSSVLLSGCLLTETKIEPIQFSDYQIYQAEQEAPLALNWWNALQNPELEELILIGLSKSPTIEQAYAKLEQAEASKTISRSSLFPNVTGNTNASKSYKDSRDKSVSAGIAASYELDLWGKYRAEAQQGDVTYRQEQWDLQTAKLSLSAEIATSWLNIAALNDQIRILKDQIKANQDVLSLQNNRYIAGTATALDVLQQEESLASVKAQLPGVQSDLEQEQNALSVLLGVLPDEARAYDFSLEGLAPVLDVSEFNTKNLKDRPDIASSWMGAVAQTYQIDQARADILPDLSLSAASNWSGAVLSQLTNNWILSLAGELSATLFDAGSRQAEVARNKAVLKENLGSYKEVVLTAIKEVKNAVISYQYQMETLALQEEQKKHAQKALKQAEQSYIVGETTYLNVLTYLTSLQSLDLTLVNSKRDLLIDQITFYRALGGVVPEAQKTRKTQ